jgi:hypothetical protein
MREIHIYRGTSLIRRKKPPSGSACKIQGLGLRAGSYDIGCLVQVEPRNADLVRESNIQVRPVLGYRVEGVGFRVEGLG